MPSKNVTIYLKTKHDTMQDRSNTIGTKARASSIILKKKVIEFAQCQVSGWFLFIY